MGVFIGLVLLAAWMARGLIISVISGDLLGFGSGNVSYDIGSLTGSVLILILLIYTLREIIKRWPDVRGMRRQRGNQRS
jgi:hypothetical protein